MTATVRGSEWYQVHLTRFGDEILASCGCPYFTDRNDFCKHIWAVILAADAQGYLIGDSPLTSDVYLESAYTGGGRFEHGGVAAGRKGPSSREPWKQFLEAVQQRAITAAPASASRYANGQILYVLDRDAAATEAPMLQVHWRARKKNGEWGKPQPAAVSAADLEQLPDETDREILAMLLGAADPYGYGNYASVAVRASFRLGRPLLDRIIGQVARSGRLFLRASERTPPILTPLAWDEGPAWQFRLDVTIVRDDQIRVDGALEREGERITVQRPELLIGTGFVVVEQRVARLETRGAAAWLMELRKSGPLLVPNAAAPSLLEAMATSGIDPSPLPEALRYEVTTATPRPRVRIARAAKPQGYGTREELNAAVEFDYGGTTIAAASEGDQYDAERRLVIRRNREAEQAALQRLQQLGFHRPWYIDARVHTLAIPVDRFPDAVRALVDEGWHVEAEGRVFRAARHVEMQVTSGIDWFELHGRVDFGDGRSTKVGDLLAALARGEATVLLDDGSRGLLPEEWLRRFARIAAFGEAKGDHVRYRPSQTSLLDALLETQPAVSVDEAFARARAGLAEFAGIEPLDPPATFRGRLRDYQRDALGWFAFLRRFGFGGCLADDMGLGKTVMVLALLDSRRQQREPGAPRTSVAVVPRSLIFNWIDEGARFAPELRILDYTGEARASAQIDEYDLLLTTYGTLRRDAAALTEREFDYVVLDEAQAIKNASTASAKAARLLRGRHRLALSGTPIENHLGELWSLFEFLNPGFLGPAAAFGRAVAPQGRTDRSDRLDLAVVGRALRPFILRRTKEQVAPELPDKLEQTIHCELEPAQRRFYDELRAHYRQRLLATVARKGMNRSKLQVLEALLRLRQAASHPGLVDHTRSSESSAKFDMLLSRLPEIAEEGHKALVFSQFTTLLGLLRPRLEAQGITYEYLDGRTRDRAERVARFEGDPECAVFLISLKAGGVGLNLTAADYVFLLDPWWNPAVEAQAVDRAHRIGQARHVFAYRLIARDTVEEKIAELQQTKRELADALFSEEAGLMKTLQPEDLEWLLS